MTITDLSRLSIHTMTTKPWSLAQCLDGFRRAGVPGITVWRQSLADLGLAGSARLIRASGMTVTALCRGGFFPATGEAARRTAIDDNLRAIDEAAAIGAPMVVLVCGAVPGMALADARAQIRDGIGACEAHARASRVRLAIEPLHPLYAADRSAVNTLRQARTLCSELGSPWVGIAVDVYHTWWDDQLETEIGAAGALGQLFGFHLCDWRVETRDLLNDRGVMGDGCIDLPRIRGWMERAGFAGWHEVEVFSHTQWARDQNAVVADIVAAYRAHC
jgi:sugar phosphate isomerase/epimerase